jgi:endonuclease G, mitochondrial
MTYSCSINKTDKIMLTKWTVLNYLANRYGKLDSIIAQDEERLKLARDGVIKIESLETNPVRYAQRQARTFTSEFGTERLLGVADFQDVIILEKMRKQSKAVCRLTKRGQPIGTGFLIAESLIITNHHVITDVADAMDMIAEFDFELGPSLTVGRPSSFRLVPQKFFLTSSLEQDPNIPNSGLDFTIIGIENTSLDGNPISQYEPLYLDGNLGKIIKGECCVVIQHPSGLPKKIVLTGNAFFSETTTRLIYESDTLPGSSGAAVIALGTGELIALHHSGLPRTDKQNRILTKAGAVATSDTDDDDIDWIANEGIKISCIVNAIRTSKLKQEWEMFRTALLSRTEQIADNLKSRINNVDPNATRPKEITQKETPPGSTLTPNADNAVQEGNFILITNYNPENISRIETILTAQYQTPVKLSLAMPGVATVGHSEMFTVKLPVSENVHQAALKLTHIPGVEFAEADTPLALNADPRATPSDRAPAESAIIDDGLGTWDEEQFLIDYENNSLYVKGKTPQEYRKWNWQATGFDKALAPGNNVASPREKGVRIVQFDTGYSNHLKIKNGFDYEQDFNFLANTDDAFDPQTLGILKFPGHGTRTGSILIGESNALLLHEGNEGLLSPDHFKLVPYRIAESVILINRQLELATALDRALVQGFDIITMSLGLVPTITTAKLAKLAYDRGVIWCCAAGNEVKAVVAPAVFPGTIAVAASNPLDEPWKGSSRGDTVDITAPGEDVYIPIWNKNKEEDFSYGNGTSYATPHVAAAAAYWLAKHHDALSTGDYPGWKRVEAFRQALYASARDKKKLPRGFGKGFLDVEKLLSLPLTPAKKLQYAYNHYNENAFFATLQGYAELAKSLWNSLHGMFGANRNEAIFSTPSLSPFAQALEKTLPKTEFKAAESDANYPLEDLRSRYNELNNVILKSLK